MSNKSHFMQHHVAKTYLKPWAFKVTGRSVWVDTYTPTGAYIGESRTGDILREPNMHTIINPDGSRDLRWEHWLDRCEAEYAKVRERVLYTRHIYDDTDLQPILLFVAAQRNRTLHIINRHTKNQQTFDDLDKAHGFRPRLLASGHVITAEEAAASTGNIITDIVMPEIHRLVSLMEGMYSSIILTKDAAGFWTCDNPVVMADGTGSGVFNILAPDARIVLPISPTTCIRLSRKRMGKSLFSGLGLHSFNLAVQRQASKLVLRKRV